MSYAEDLAGQLGTQAASTGLGGIMDLIFQPWRNRQQQDQNAALLKQNVGAQKEMGEFNYQKQLEMWNATNSEAQMKHLKDAGLNPALMYGGGGGGGSTTTGGGGMGISGAAAQVSQGNNGMNILLPAQVELMKAQARNLDANTAKTAGADTTKTTTETSVLQTQNELQKLDLKVNENTLWERINEIVSRSIQQQEQGIIAGQQRTIGEETINANISKIKQEAVNTLIQAEVMRSHINLNEAQINKLSQDIIQRGQEIAIKTFEAETEANQPGLGKIIGSLILPLSDKINKIAGMDKTREVKK